MIQFNLKPSQRKKDEIDYKIFSDIIKYHNIKLTGFYNSSNNRKNDMAKIQNIFELMNVWSKMKNFYLDRFSNENSKNYNKSIVNAVNEVTSLLKQRTIEAKNKAWFIYLYLESKELSHIRYCKKNI